MNRWHLKSFITVLGIILTVSWGACREDFDYPPSSGNLEFSKDTVFLDTVFTNIGSSTYSLKVYNRSNQDILIPFVGLESGQESSYRLNVDGQAGKEFNNVPLLAKDSLFVFIETTFDIGQTPENEFLYTDALLFGTGDERQQVELVTLIKDAIFLYPNTQSDGTKETLVLGLDDNGEEIRAEGFFLEPEQLQFSNEKPYAIYGYAAVPENENLIIDAGVRVHFHNNSGIIVSDGATLNINGLLSEDQDILENEVIFEGDRLEPLYEDVPGQWGAIWLREGSINNVVNHLTIKNATIGLRVEGEESSISPTLTLKNTQVYNSSNHNLWASSAHIIAENTVLGNSANSSFYGNLGGIYNFTHCTLANFWSSGPGSGTALLLNNSGFLANGETMARNLESADFTNCIIDSNQSIAFVLERNDSADFNFGFKNCLLKFNDTSNRFEGNPLFNFEDIDLYQNVILNEDSDFTGPFENQFQIGDNSAAIDNAEANLSPPILIDILGIERSPNPDIGAYENASN
ncbi:hypothetical protein LV716_15380 [Flagellimonas sp. HMM57]|uniref:hypothetical protein n=1 Tax=unclassified Flagellimonas TaxID=2644544 RepID=UPI001F0A4FB6|nr:MULTISPECIES: hypothetical protein [unclassified Flagellimonas]UII75626.1 hypothetical protein LV716_15380 [Flagellimonas sp. HMM57]